MTDYRPLLKRDVRKNSNITMLAIILYTITMYAVVIISQIVHSVYIFLMYSGDEYINKYNEYVDSVSDSAWSTMGAILVGLIIIYLFSRHENIKSLIFSKKRQMTPKTFLLLLVVFMMVQLPFSYLSSFIEYGLNLFGLTTQADLEWATGESSSFSMLIYTSFFAPVCEELVYRGYVMRNMQRYGKSVAIIFSATIFGIMHGNIHQILFAFVVGLILGYTAMEYSIFWSIALHFTNNYLFGEVLDAVLSFLPETVGGIISWGLLFLFMIGGIVVLSLKSKDIKQYISTLNFNNKKLYLWAFTTPAFIIFFAFCMFEMISGINTISY